MNDEQLEALVTEYVERCEKGEGLTPESFVRQHPEGGERLLAALQRVKHTEDMFPSVMTDLPARIGPYRVLEQIARGGMGRVLRVELVERPGRHLALKLLHLASGVESRARDRLDREGAVLQRLDHPNIVRVHEVGVAGDTPYIAMELLEGATLAQRIAAAARESRLPEERRFEAARTVAALARAVSVAHGEGLLHRDLKPANVVVVEERGPVLIDFGLAGGDAGPTLTMSGDLLGTPNYMAPEQARGQRADERSDVYGLGAILYELTTLAPPHRGTDPLQVLESVKSRPVTMLRRLEPGVPRDLATIVDCALSFQPAHRYGSAAELADDLEAFLGGKPIHAVPKSLARRALEYVGFHRQAVVVAVGLLLIAILLAAVLRPSELERKIELAAAAGLATHAWLEGSDAQFEAAVATVEELEPEHWVARFLRVRRGGELPDAAPEDPLLAALFESERHRRARDYEAAFAAAERAAAIEQEPGLSLVVLARAARRAEQHDVARSRLAAAVRMLPQTVKLRRELGVVLKDKGDLRGALAVLEDAEKIAPEDPKLLFDIARVLYKMKQAARALEYVERAQLLWRGEPPRGLLKYLAALLDNDERRAESLELHDRLLRRWPEDYQIQFNRARVLDSMHRFFEARDGYLAALALREGADVLFSLAWLHSGSDRKCAECRAFFAKHPELRDIDKVEQYYLRVIDVDRGKGKRILPGVVAQLRGIGRREKALARLRELLAGGGLSDGQELRIRRGIDGLGRR